MPENVHTIAETTKKCMKWKQKVKNIRIEMHTSALLRY